MSYSGRVVRRTVILLLATGLSGCATVSDLMESWRSGGVTGRVPLEQRPVEEPLPANEFLLTSADQSIIGELQLVFTQQQDTLSDLAREYGLGYDELLAANPGVDPWLPGENTAVLLPTQYILPDVPRTGVVLNMASKRLFYFPPAADGEAQTVLTYPIGIGRVGWETPLGSTKVISKATDPHWWVPASIRKEHAEMGDPLPAVVPPGPDNPLGAHVLKLDMPGYLIHGTNQPYGVGMRVSHGCVRLYPENIEFLYSLVGIGESVLIINEPYLLGAIGEDVYFESHAPLEDDPIPPAERLQTLLAGGDIIFDLDEQEHIRSLAGTSSGVPVHVASADAEEVLARVRVVRNTVTADPDEPTLEEVREMMDEVLRESEAEQL